MKLTKQQVDALVQQEAERQNKIINEHNKKVSEEQRKKNLPKAKGLVDAMEKLQNLADKLDVGNVLEYRFRGESRESRVRSVLNSMVTNEGKMPSFDGAAYERKIHLASIDANDLNELLKRLAEMK